MIERSDVISFFDRCAPNWDAEMIRNEPVIRTILDNAGIRAGIDVLDVACGTGVLFPDYLARDVPCAMDRRPPVLSSVARCAIRRAGSGKCGKAL